MENNGGTAWSPILGQGNFHRATRFGRVTWTTKEALAARADAGAAGGAADAGALRDGGRPSDAGAAGADAATLDPKKARIHRPSLDVPPGTP